MPRFTTSDPLRSRSTGFEAGQRIQFQSRSDLSWLAVLTESVYKLELRAATVIGTMLTTLGYSENWRVTTVFHTKRVKKQFLHILVHISVTSDPTGMLHVS